MPQSVLVTAVVSSQEKDYDFFPLTVDYIEKMYAVGRIPGGYLKREAKPSDHGTLVARMVDRPIRPGFPDGYKNEVHIVATPFVIDGENLPTPSAWPAPLRRCSWAAPPSTARRPACASAATSRPASSS